MGSSPSRKNKRLIVGWREWIALPELQIPRIKVKIDTGARSSSLHAYDIEQFQRDGKAWIRFIAHPFQRDLLQTITCEAPLLDIRKVRSSNGECTDRPVIVTTIRMDEHQWPIELTLASRDAMGFRMLLGREALRGRALVDPGRSYLVSRRPGERSHGFRNSKIDPA